ncbi:hypothetical protein B0H16DRAFT_1579569 [Mycena metata]|uniref:T6SS Phospholipase effector Tle1-like catalytic domain-containing protein n=1 Tax=Mycena metata TaxID=1033252 RepID=A0AAD7MUP7_9AGAR|nr:hypothetical protein B0H16DRAFT_1579569 [Mycena metata]
MTPHFIPERPKDANYRTLVILLDGTGDRDDNDVTNIVMLHKMLSNGKDHPGNNTEQLVHYREGIGADVAKDYTGLVRYGWNKAKNALDQAVATSFKNHIIAAYSWLAKNYQDNDRICIFGFSRGAYSARALAGMLKAMGLSTTASAEEAYHLYEEYNDLPPDGPERDKAFSDLLAKWKTFRDDSKHNVRTPLVEFLGCWDSVNSVGTIDNIKLAYTATNDTVRTFRHALALDERRAKFKQNIWGPPKRAANARGNGDNGPSVVTDVQEVWFAGCHCDVGGGSVLNGTRPNLAHISLRWMIRECFKARTGMIFSAPDLAKLGIDPSHLYPDVRLRPDVPKAATGGSQTISVIEAPKLVPWMKSFVYTTPETVQELTLPYMSEEELDARDALAPLYDQLVLKSATWQVLESLMIKKIVYDAATNTFKSEWHRHNSIGRSIPAAENTHGGKIRVHRTVQMRMQSVHENGPEKGEPYNPKARVGWGGKFEDKLPFKEVSQDLIEWVW